MAVPERLIHNFKPGAARLIVHGRCSLGYIPLLVLPQDKVQWHVGAAFLLKICTWETLKDELSRMATGSMLDRRTEAMLAITRIMYVQW